MRWIAIAGLALLLAPSARAGSKGCAPWVLSEMLWWAREERYVFDKVSQERPTKRDFAPEASVALGPEIEASSPMGKRRLLARIGGKPWQSAYEYEKNAPQGDPRAFRFISGSDEVSRFFGFEQVDANTLAVPLSDRFNWAVEAARSVSPRFKPGLKLKKVRGKAGDREFVETLVREQALVVDEPAPGAAPDAATLLGHDAAYHHAAAVYTTETELSLALRQGKELLALLDYLKATEPELSRTGVFERLLGKFGARFDTGNGTASLNLALDQPDSLKRAFDSLLLMTSGGVSPKDFLRKLFEDHVLSSPGAAEKAPGLNERAARRRPSSSPAGRDPRSFPEGCPLSPAPRPGSETSPRGSPPGGGRFRRPFTSIFAKTPIPSRLRP